jgi:hypothetical protein
MAPRKAAKAAAPEGANGLRRVDQLGRQIGAEATPASTTPQADALAVYDGAAIVGCIAECRGRHFAYDATGYLIGAFKTRAQAMRSIPAVRS